MKEVNGWGVGVVDDMMVGIFVWVLVVDFGMKKREGGEKGLIGEGFGLFE